MTYSTTLGLLAFLTLSTCGSASPLRKLHPTVVLGGSNNVQFEGTSANNVESFMNIRFAEDTSGNNRFAAPKPFSYPSGSVVNASLPGAACPQQKVPIPGLEVFDNVTHISEDCLTLRVDRPIRKSNQDKLPVMAFIYGGGDSIGQIYDTAYDPTSLINGAEQKGYPVIYVAMNYRVGIFGFAATQALNESRSLNAGLRDQRLALENISLPSGGDPDNVTIFGESDGATGVGLQITAYGGKEKAPFQRAIMQSGSAAADQGTATNKTVIRTTEFIKKVNCSSSVGIDELACLRKIPLKKLLPAALDYEFSFEGSMSFDIFVPTAPSDFIPDSPSKLLSSGRFAHDIDVITGWTEDDQSFFTPSTIKTESDAIKYLSSSMPDLSEENMQRALALYPSSLFSDMPSENISAQYFRASQMSRDYGFTCPSIHLVQMNKKYSKPCTSNYLYILNQTMFAPLYEQQQTSYLGVSHFSDIPYVFNQAKTRYSFLATPIDVEISSKMSASWASFAVSGDPSHRNGTLSGWSDALTHSSPTVRIIGGPDGGKMVTIDGSGDTSERLAKRCAFWSSPEVLAQIGV
ncbi:carboxylesterase [Penicillium waksmanii]|uniref:carboxylesterase n=1 Tax=Penicillium waksmanii TaxID=69791 RepID=UPI002548CE6F|nr:carboxylesterase [Penicillium waksmanii]KAJ5983670.1 carboxylesterase [Penicillium waksmanii]